MKEQQPKSSRIRLIWTQQEDNQIIKARQEGVKWTDIQQLIPGRSKTDCQTRWYQVLDPKLKVITWTQDEDTKIIEWVKENGMLFRGITKEFENKKHNHILHRWNYHLKDGFVYEDANESGRKPRKHKSKNANEEIEDSKNSQSEKQPIEESKRIYDDEQHKEVKLEFSNDIKEEKVCKDVKEEASKGCYDESQCNLNTQSTLTKLAEESKTPQKVTNKKLNPTPESTH